MIDDMIADNCGFPDEPVQLGAECEAEAARVKASLGAPPVRIGPRSTFELAAQLDSFRAEQQAEHLRAAAREIDPRYRASEDAAAARLEMVLNRSDEIED
jgi:hypothetical protein